MGLFKVHWVEITWVYVKITFCQISQSGSVCIGEKAYFAKLLFYWMLICRGNLLESKIWKIYNPNTLCFTLQTRRLSSLVGWWWTASGGKVRNQITLIKTWTSTIPVQIQSWDFGEIKLGLLADCVEALKIREIRLVFVNRAP